MKLILMLTLLFIFVSCKKNRDNSSSEIFFQIEINVAQNMDCGLPEIIFLTNKDKAYDIIGDNKGVYIAYGLPKDIYQRGDKFWVRIRKPITEEFVVCRALGQAWSEVTITDIKKRD